jgi:phosphotransferase system IIB component
MNPMTKLLINFLCLGCATAALGAGDKLDTAAIEKITGLKGTLNEQENVFKVSSPRSDVKITVDGWAMPPFMGLTSWAAFTEGKRAPAMVMGDLVLLQDEVNPVMSTLLDNGLSVTALHNHFFYDEPKVYFIHIDGEGSVGKLATGVRQALDKVKEIRAALPQPPAKFGGDAIPEKSAISAEPLEKILGVKGQSKDGMFKAVIGRKTKMSCGCEVGKEMGVNTWAAFAGSDDNAIVDGDFAVHEDELQSVLKSLRHAGVNIVAIHHHMSGETPRILFLHYWGKGRAATLAQGLKAALGEIKQ